jgi:hypothetical protein
MVGSSFVPGMLYRALEDFIDCKKCKKAKNTLMTLALYIFTSLGAGALTGIIFTAFGLLFGFSEPDLEQFAFLPMFAGATAFLWWVNFNFDKMVCGCE